MQRTMGINIMNEDKDNIKEYITEQITESEIELNKNIIEFKDIQRTLRQVQRNFEKKEDEFQVFTSFYPKYIKPGYERELLPEYKDVNDSKVYLDIDLICEEIEEIKKQLDLLEKTIHLKKQNIETIIKKLVDLNVNLTWVVKE